MESYRFVIRVDLGGESQWTLVDGTDAVRARDDGPYPSVDACRAAIDAYRRAHPETADAPIEEIGVAPNL